MSPRYQFELARPQEDGALRAILKNTFMEGSIALSFQREPSFFVAERAGNLEVQTIIVRDTDSGKIVGTGTRAVRCMFVDGKPSFGGYLNGLRGLPEIRRGLLLARGYQFLKKLHQDGKVPYYVTTILDENEYAKEQLTSGRAGLPVYHPLGRLHTYLLPLYQRKKYKNRQDSIVKSSSPDTLDTAVQCMNAWNKKYQFAPWYTEESFQGSKSLYPGFHPENLYAYQRDGDVTATIGVWDQSSFKQSVVYGYNRRYRTFRPLSNAGARLGISPKLPRIGESLPYVYASFISYAAGCETDFAGLLKRVLDDWSRQQYAYLVIGVHERNPLAALLKEFAAMCLSSTVYMVYWKDALDCPLPSESRTPHLEVATL